MSCTPPRRNDDHEEQGGHGGSDEDGSSYSPIPQLLLPPSLLEISRRRMALDEILEEALAIINDGPAFDAHRRHHQHQEQEDAEEEQEGTVSTSPSSSSMINRSAHHQQPE